MPVHPGISAFVVPEVVADWDFGYSAVNHCWLFIPIRAREPAVRVNLRSGLVVVPAATDFATEGSEEE